jgi:hypothetical protein
MLLKPHLVLSEKLRKQVELDQKDNITAPNTDNKGKLFVTLFAFLPAGRQVLLHSRQLCNGSCTRTRASARNLDPAP